MKNCDLSDIISEDVEEKIKTVAEMSMGTEITEIDITNIWYLCDQVRMLLSRSFKCRHYVTV